MVTGSSPDDWTVHVSGPFFLDRLGEVMSADQRWLEVGSHDYLAVYNADVDLQLAAHTPARFRSRTRPRRGQATRTRGLSDSVRRVSRTARGDLVAGVRGIPRRKR